MMPGSRATEEFSEAWATAMATVETSTEETRRAVIKLTIDMDELFGRQMDAREAAIAYEQALDDLTEGFKRGSDALDINTQKGRDNLTLVNDTINAARDQLKADMEAAAGNKEAIAAANARYQAQLDRLREVLRALGLNEQAIEDLIGIAGAIPRDVTIDVSLFGARAAIGMLNSLGGAIARVAGVGGISASASRQMKKRATGGPVVKGEAYIVGDGGKPEVFVPNSNGRILPDASALARHAVAAGGSGSRSGSPSLRYSGTPRGLEVMFLSWLQKQIQIGQLQLSP
jgi:outer membrane murein-binding lipoprotein Lpp